MRLFILIFILSTTAYCQDPFKYILKEIRGKNYTYALVKLKKVKGNQVKRNFLEAICYTNLGDPKKALKNLIKIKGKRGTDYEFGRAYYFIGAFKKARKHFNISIRDKYKVAQSNHFIGKSHMNEEDFKVAKPYFQNILNDKKASRWIIQEAYYQIGNIHLQISKRELLPEDMGNILKNHVLTYFKKSLQIAPDSKVAKKVRNVTYLITTKYKIK